jgi:drug/metabolite transporter (DMT)-like permease
MDPRLYLVAGCVFGAGGQVLLKLGATGAASLRDYANLRVLSGLTCYGFGAALWLGALTHLPLTRVYPFTMLTFVLVYLASVWLLGERLTTATLVGVFLVLSGLVVISIA